MEHTMTICYCEDESAQAKAFAIKIDQWAKNKNIEVHADLFESAEEYLFKAEQNIYSWWSYRFKAREKNAGWRIDYFLVSKRLETQLKSATIHTEIFGSDHCPVEVDLF